MTRVAFVKSPRRTGGIPITVNSTAQAQGDRILLGFALMALAMFLIPVRSGTGLRNI